MALLYIFLNLKSDLYHLGIIRRGNRPRRMDTHSASTAEALGIKPRRRSLLHQMAGTISHKHSTGVPLHTTFIIEADGHRLDIDEAFCLGTVVGASIQAEDTMHNLLTGNAVQFESTARARYNILGAIILCLAALGTAGPAMAQARTQPALVHVGNFGVYACTESLELHLYYDGRVMLERTDTESQSAPRWMQGHIYQLDHHTWMAELEDGTWASIDAQAGWITQTILTSKKHRKNGKQRG